jgi:transcriptional regulator with XRE-family HTH domain
MSRRQLAKELGVDEKALRQWETRPDAPQSKDVAEWKAYIEANHLAKGMTRQSYADLREEKIKEEIALLRLKKRREEGKTILIDDVREYLGRLGAKWDQLLTQKLETEIPARLVGKDIVAARAEARAVHDEIREICNAGIVGAEKELTT